MAFDRRRTAGGAIAGVAAAGLWALQQPADKAILRCDYDDTEVLGKLMTRGARWRAAGLALHLANGAAFGAAYAMTAARAPGPGWVKGTTAALAENFAGWPLAGLVDRFHPARDELPRLAGNRAALAQATWRHALFGVVLGVLEERINGSASTAPAEPPAHSNGHGDISRAATGQA